MPDTSHFDQRKDLLEEARSEVLLLLGFKRVQEVIDHVVPFDSQLKELLLFGSAMLRLV